jgi:hypothetical protein
MTSVTSWSPRPETLMTTVLVGAHRAAAATIAPWIACEVWSAGMMPSMPREQLEGLERLGVGGRDILDALRVLPPAVPGADALVVEAGAARADVGGLAKGRPAAHSCIRAAQDARRSRR